ncbi:MAG: AAA family ATPase [Candidatus Aenigmarchaeota archaeon]|nr:AAA family ATPase [Candidatus Aenigmarchaeota archaeon]MDW8149732.1 AAA family ATPase [Candidatus Aenigmarchaeota archaeon]
MIIGIVGTIGSGKDEVAKFLSSYFGFPVVRLSDIIKIFLNNEKFDRKKLQDLGNELRKKFGSDILVRIVTNFYKDNVIIDGIRNVAEIEYLRKNFSKFMLIGVDADLKTRFERVKKRGREDDPKSFEEFLEMDKRDRGFEEPEYGQKTDECLKLADVRILNNEDFDIVKKKLISEVSQIL